jgi:large subunit ribosomal protein L14e
MSVTDVDSRLQIGQIVQVLQGRDAGEYAIVIGFEKPRFVWLADGDKRKFDRPKKKNVKHIQPTNQIAEDVVKMINETGRVTNAMLRYALNQYLLQQKGE